MFKTIIEFMDGQTKEIATRHISRTDKEAGVFRLLFEHDEITYPLINIRSIRTEIIPDPDQAPLLKPVPASVAPVIDAEKVQKDEWAFEIPFLKRGKKE